MKLDDRTARAARYGEHIISIIQLDVIFCRHLGRLVVFLRLFPLRVARPGSNCGSFLGLHMPAVMNRSMVALSVLHASTARLLAHRFQLGDVARTTAQPP